MDQVRQSLHVLLLFLAVFTLQCNAQCEKRKFDQDSFVCVCNSTYCDEIGKTIMPKDGEFVLYTSNRDEYRMSPSAGQVEDEGTGTLSVKVSTRRKYQKMIGFGAAFTDSAGINLQALSDAARENILRSYFAPEGSEYSVARIPIGCSDFSPRPYSYDDTEGDTELTKWALQEEDYEYKIPFIQRAIELSPHDIRFFGSPWAPPSWMKSTGTFNDSGTLLPQYWQPFSEYIVKFVNAYEAENITIWGLTPQNEPLNCGGDFPTGIPCCFWSAEDSRDWIKTNLGPTLEKADLRRVQMMIVDHNRDMAVDYAGTILADEDASKYVDGVAMHWYMDRTTGPETLEETHDLDPSKFMLYTEACEGVFVPTLDMRVLYGNWSRAEDYIFNIMEDMNYWSTGWVEWNLALDLQGGPSWVKDNFFDASILVDADNDEFYKQPMYYALAHASKFIVRDGERVDAVPDDESISSSAVVNPDGTIVVLLLNKNEDITTLSVVVDEERFVNIEMPPRSIHSLLVAAN